MFGLWTTIQLLFAGIGPMIWHWGVGVGIIVICVLLEIFSASLPLIGPYLGEFRKWVLAIAVCTAMYLLGVGIGVKDEANRCIAKSVVVEKTVDRAVNRARKPRAGGLRHDRWDVNEP